MTLIMSSVLDDGIVIVGDGNAHNEQNELKETDFQKVYLIKNDVYFAISAERIALNFPPLIPHIMAEHLSFNPPYSMEQIAQDFAGMIKKIFPKSEDLTQFVLGGYDRDSSNNATSPALFYMEAMSDFEVNRVSLRKTCNLGLTKDRDTSVKLKGWTVESMKYALVYKIREIESIDSRVGGDIMIVTIKADGATAEKHKRLIK